MKLQDRNVPKFQQKEICLNQESVVAGRQLIKTEQKEVTAILVLRQEILVHRSAGSINALQHCWPREQVRFAVCTATILAKALPRAPARGSVAAESSTSSLHTPGMQQKGQTACAELWHSQPRTTQKLFCNGRMLILISHLSDMWTAILKNPTNKALQAKTLQTHKYIFQQQAHTKREQNTEFITLAPVSVSKFCSCLTASILLPFSTLVFYCWFWEVLCVWGRGFSSSCLNMYFKSHWKDLTFFLLLFFSIISAAL